MCVFLSVDNHEPLTWVSPDACSSVLLHTIIWDGSNGDVYPKTRFIRWGDERKHLLNVRTKVELLSSGESQLNDEPSHLFINVFFFLNQHNTSFNVTHCDILFLYWNKTNPNLKRFNCWITFMFCIQSGATVEHFALINKDSLHISRLFHQDR